MMVTKIECIDPEPKNYNDFIKLVKTISKKCIPKGCRSNCISGLNPNAANKLDEYLHKYDADPFSKKRLP